MNYNEELSKIQSMLDSTDTSLQSVGYLLAREMLNLSDATIVQMMLNSNKGGEEPYLGYHFISWTKYMFNGWINLCIYNANDPFVHIQLHIDNYMVWFGDTLDNKLETINREINNWFSRLKKES